MIELGKVQKLNIIRMTSIGAFLNTNGNNKEEEILLPKNQVSENAQIGDEIEVFVYKDSKDRIIATIKRPQLTLGELAVLKVVDVNKIGAFLDWGLEKDLFLPYHEQTTRVHKGRSYLVGLYIDKSNRLCATMKVYDFLRSDSPYMENDKIWGTVYKVDNEIGAFVAVDNKYYGLIPTNELFQSLKSGDKVEGRVTKIREDGKIDISIREKSYIQMDDDAKAILGKLLLNGGQLPFNDNSEPEIIKKEFKISKRAFKRAIGKLLREGKIIITEDGIKENKNNKNNK